MRMDVDDKMQPFGEAEELTERELISRRRTTFGLWPVENRPSMRIGTGSGAGRIGVSSGHARPTRASGASERRSGGADKVDRPRTVVVQSSVTDSAIKWNNKAP
jgi:hypothetical protein